MNSEQQRNETKTHIFMYFLCLYLIYYICIQLSLFNLWITNFVSMQLTLLQVFESAFRVTINVLSRSKIIVEKRLLKWLQTPSMVFFSIICVTKSNLFYFLLFIDMDSIFVANVCNKTKQSKTKIKDNDKKIVFRTTIRQTMCVRSMCRWRIEFYTVFTLVIN